MAFQLAEAYVELSSRGMGGLMSNITRVGAGLASMGPMALAAGAGLAAIGGAAGAAGLISLAAEAESTAVQFETLLQSADAAKDHIADLRDFGASTPFEFSGLANTSKTLLAFGVAADQVLPTMRVLGDVSSATGSDLNELATVFGKIRGQGKLTGETLDQLVERKVPIINELAKSFGVPEAAIRKMVTEGKIGFGDVQKAMNSLTAEGGMMAGGMAKQSQTLGGLWSTFTDEMTGLMTDVANALAEGFALKEGTSLLTEFVSWFRGQVIPAIVGGADLLRTFLVDPIIEVVRNWDVYFKLAGEYAKLAFTNAGVAVNWFFENGIDLAKWYYSNLGNFALDFVNYQFTMFQNLWELLKAGYESYWAWLAGGETTSFDDRLKALHKFESSVTEFQGKGPEWIRTSDEIERLTAEAARRRSEGVAAGAAKDFGAMSIDAANAFGEKAGDKIADKLGAGGALAGLPSHLFREFGLAAIPEAFQGDQAKALEAAEQSRDHLAKIAGAVTDRGIRLDAGGGGGVSVPYRLDWDAL